MAREDGPSPRAIRGREGSGIPAPPPFHEAYPGGRSRSPYAHRSSVPLADVLRLLAGASANGQVRAATAAMLAAVVRGQNLTRPLREHPVFPPVVEQLVAVGEETAELDRVLLHLGRHLERETDEAVDALSSIVEPALIVLIGLVVGSVLVALYLPMFDLLSIVEQLRPRNT